MKKLNCGSTAQRAAIITDITQQVKNKKRYSVFLDGEFAFGIDGTDLLQHRLEIGQKLERDEYVKLLIQLEYTACRDAAVRYLGRGLRSVQQLRDKLAEKEFSPASTQRVIDLLTERGYLNDVEFALAFIAHKVKINNFGRRRIEWELKAKGVAERDVSAAFEQFYESGNDEERKDTDLSSARTALAKKIRNRDLSLIKDDPKELNRLKDYLARRGFDFDTIDAVLEED